jgi:hypothetical protein
MVVQRSRQYFRMVERKFWHLRNGEPFRVGRQQSHDHQRVGGRDAPSLSWSVERKRKKEGRRRKAKNGARGGQANYRGERCGHDPSFHPPRHCLHKWYTVKLSTVYEE